jgi:DNA repair exonuclease SbcCD ATPase subunit
LNKNKKRLLESAATWDSNKEAKLLSQAELLSTLMSIDIEQELKNHDIIKEINEIELYVKDINNSISKIDSNIRNNKKLLELTISKIENIHKNVCFNCKQEYHGDHSLLSTLENDVVRISEDISRDTEIINELNMELNNNTIHPKPNTYYSKWSDALEHKHSMSHVQNKILDIDSEINPYSSQLNDIDGDLKTIDYTTLNNLNSLLDHQEFLLKLLTNKDSFIRQKIINQNINFLNSRLEFYLNKLGLQHVVKFLSDLDVEISYLGKDLDFDNLSRGERTRLILSLSLSFRDAYEALNDKINLLFVDELIDTGLDPSGVESSLSTLKGLVRDTNRSIFLISHRDELLGRIDTILKVIKENGFTSFEQ